MKSVTDQNHRSQLESSRVVRMLLLNVSLKDPLMKRGIQREALGQ